MVGDSVIVRTPSFSYDSHKNELVTWAEQTVDDVIIAPSAASDIDEDGRHHGTRARIKCGFPKGFSSSLRGCHVVCGPPFSGEYAVIGDPKPNFAANCPTRWWYTAECEAVNG